MNTEPMSTESISTETKSLPLRLLQFTPATRKILWEGKFDIVLLLASTFCFGVFLERSFNSDQISGIGGSIALMTEGSASGKLLIRTGDPCSAPSPSF